jgi:hypothetical protein
VSGADPGLDGGWSACVGGASTAHACTTLSGGTGFRREVRYKDVRLDMFSKLHVEKELSEKTGLYFEMSKGSSRPIAL